MLQNSSADLLTGKYSCLLVIHSDFIVSCIFNITSWNVHLNLVGKKNYQNIEQTFWKSVKITVWALCRQKFCPYLGRYFLSGSALETS